MSIGIAILAAGKGTRLKIERAKALCPALGMTLVDYVILGAQQFGKDMGGKLGLAAVVGHKREEVEAHIKSRFPQIEFAWQKQQLGTGDALRSYFEGCPDRKSDEFTFIVCADTPLVTSSTFSKLWDEMKAKPNLQGVAATFKTQAPTGYGRILRQGQGFRIVEEKDASDSERLINEVNSGFYLVKTAYLLEKLKTLDNKNKSNEFYLTDIFSTDVPTGAVCFSDETDFLGVNTLVQLESVTQILRRRKLNSLMSQGVICFDASTTWVDWDVEIGPETIIHPGAKFYGKTRIGKNVQIEDGVVIKDSVIEDGAHILGYSYLEQCVVHAEAHVGPFARLRPESDIGQKAKVGNFVEIKKSVLKAGSKVSHLSYIGDAEVGENSNVGCGFITCNYDGANKHRTEIGKNVFIGSDVQVIAPLKIGDSAFIAAGSTITADVPSEAFAIARSKQMTKENAARRFLKSKKT